VFVWVDGEASALEMSWLLFVWIERRNETETEEVMEK
jgi:hypothetical protein